MTAHGVHGIIKRKFRKMCNIINFDNLKNYIIQSENNFNILELKDLRRWQNEGRPTNIKSYTLYDFKLSNVVMVRFKKELLLIKY